MQKIKTQYIYKLVIESIQATMDSVYKVCFYGGTGEISHIYVFLWRRAQVRKRIL